MTAVSEPTEITTSKTRTWMPLVLGLVLALAGGGAGFLAVSSGMIGEAGGRSAGHAVPIFHLRWVRSPLSRSTR